jgi:hypothetical protein
MRTLVKPLDDPKDVFLNCTSEIDDEDLRLRLVSCGSDVADAALDFEDKISANELYTIPRNKTTKANKNIRVLGQVTIDEMKDVYTSWFAKKDTCGRKLYDKILALPKHSKCPYCFHRQVSTVDHYLSKAYFPLLSVVPVNLLPCCKDCNFNMGSAYPKKPEDELLHPYFDNVEDELWLKAKVERTSPASVSFYVSCPKHWDKLLKARVENHFDSLSLNLLYSAEAGTELTNIHFWLLNLFDAGGMAEVKGWLKEAAESRSRAYKNSWQSAMYSALSEDTWFCNGGFNN